MSNKNSAAYRKGHDLGTAIGTAAGEALKEAFGPLLRALYAAAHGKCRACDAPLGGPSPEKICGACDVLGYVATDVPCNASGGDA